LNAIIHGLTPSLLPSVFTNKMHPYILAFRLIWTAVCARSTNAACAVTIALIVVMGVLAEGCRHCQPDIDGPRLDIRLMGADSPDEIEQMIRASFAARCLPKDIAEGYTMYQITNGPARWVFVLAANGPRGLGMLNLYCYEQARPDKWTLRGYVPLLMHYYTNSVERELHFQTNDSHINVEFRDVTVFTTASQKKSQ
jgi:hypothetical protein